MLEAQVTKSQLQFLTSSAARGGRSLFRICRSVEASIGLNYIVAGRCEASQSRYDVHVDSDDELGDGSWNLEVRCSSIRRVGC